MQCFTCKRFLKKGHGTQIWYHPDPYGPRRVGVRGENRYYCALCLKVKDYWKRMNQAKWEYEISDIDSKKWFPISPFILLASLFLLFFLQQRQMIIIGSLIIIPVFIFIDLFLYQNNKKKNKQIAQQNQEIVQKRIKLQEQYQKLKNDQWRPIAIEKALSKQKETLLKSKYPQEDFCCCSKCLGVDLKQ